MSSKTIHEFLLKNIDKNDIYLIKRKGKEEEETTAVYAHVPPKLLQVSQYQPRKIYDLESLKESISHEGIQEEIRVNEHDNGDLVIIDGVRRTKASIELGLEKVPVIIRKISERQEEELVLINNLERKEYTPMELARYFKRYKERWDVDNVYLGQKFFPSLSQKDSSSNEKTGMVTSASQKVGRYIKLLELPESIQEQVEHGYSIEKAYVLTLLRFDDPDNEPDDWKNKRLELQTNLSQSSLSHPKLREVIKQEIEKEKSIRKDIEQEIAKRKHTLEDYNQDLRDSIIDFLTETKIEFTVPFHYTEFNINELKEKKNSLEQSIKEHLIDESRIKTRRKIITLLQELSSLIPKEEYLQGKIDPDQLITYQEALTSIVENEEKTNTITNKQLDTLKIKWNNISITHRKIERFLYDEGQKKDNVAKTVDRFKTA